MFLPDNDSKTKNLKQMIQNRFQVKKTMMQMACVDRVQFAELNNNRYYFADGIVKAVNDFVY